MNVAKNWARTIINIRSFLEQTVVERANDYPCLKKHSPTLVISTQNWSILAKFAKKKISEIGCFLLIVSWRSFSPKFLWNRPSFLKICLWKSFENWLFPAKIPRNRPIFPRICPWKSREILLFFPWNIRSPVFKIKPIKSIKYIFTWWWPTRGDSRRTTAGMAKR